MAASGLRPYLWCRCEDDAPVLTNSSVVDLGFGRKGSTPRRNRGIGAKVLCTQNEKVGTKDLLHKICFSRGWV